MNTLKSDIYQAELRKLKEKYWFGETMSLRTKSHLQIAEEAAMSSMEELGRFIIWLREEKGIQYREDLLISKSNELWDLPRYYAQYRKEKDNGQ